MADRCQPWFIWPGIRRPISGYCAGVTLFESFKMKPVPILFFSDSPSIPTGLGRISKDLALLTSQLPEFRVATFGLGGNSTSKLPFQQYTIHVSEQWGESLIQ